MTLYKIHHCVSNSDCPNTMFNDFCTYNTDLEFDCPIQELVKLATMETSNNYIKNIQNEILKILNVEKIELESDKGQKGKREQRWN